MHSLMSASVCLYVLVCVCVFLLPLLLLLLVTCLRIEICWSCPYRFTSCYIPWPPFSCLSFSASLCLLPSLSCSVFSTLLRYFCTHDCSFPAFFSSSTPLPLLAWFVFRILYIPLRNSFIAAQHRLLFLLPALLLALRLDVNRIFIR